MGSDGMSLIGHAGSFLLPGSSCLKIGLNSLGMFMKRDALRRPVRVPTAESPAGDLTWFQLVLMVPPLRVASCTQGRRKVPRQVFSPARYLMTATSCLSLTPDMRESIGRAS